VGLRASLDTEVRGKILCLCRGSNPNHPVVQSVVRHCADRLPSLTYLPISVSKVVVVRAFFGQIISIILKRIIKYVGWIKLAQGRNSGGLGDTAVNVKSSIKGVELVRYVTDT
jgi:hypothetical protein